MNRALIELTQFHLLAEKILGGRGLSSMRETNNVDRPWLNPSEGHLPFMERSTVPMPAIGATSVVLQFVVPNGFDGTIKRLSNNYIGGGFVSGSGDLIWRILADGRAIKNFHNITSEFGNLSSPLDVDYIRIFSGQLIQFTVTHVANAALANSTTCHLAGYYYPRKGES